MRFTIALALLAGTSAYGQYVISAHSGVIQVVDGSAYLNDKSVAPKFGQFPDIKQDQVFRTEQGRAEVLLTPGVFLRMGENSSIRMVSTSLTDTRVEVLGGTAMVECDELGKDNAIILLYKGNNVMLVKHGLYRIDADQARFEVYDGEAIVKGESGQLTIKGGKQTSLNGVLMAEHFNKNDTDELYTWSSRRASYLAKANASSAMSLRSNGGFSGGFGGWQFNPLFGLFTFVPYNGIGYSPFGFGWWSPYTVVYYSPYGNGTYYGGGSSVSRGSYLGGSQPAAFSTFNNGRALSPMSNGGAFSRGASAPISSGGAVSMGGGGGARSSGGGARAGGRR
jgi:hypothetical protein